MLKNKNRIDEYKQVKNDLLFQYHEDIKHYLDSSDIGAGHKLFYRLFEKAPVLVVEINRIFFESITDIIRRVKMKVSIMSMQRIANYGSFLQAYALKKTIETLGHQVDFADYRVQPCLIQPQKVEQGKDTYIKDKAFRLRNAIKCFAYKIPFDQHKQFYQNYSGKYLQIIGVSDERRERPDTDVLVIGSDEVFNCVQSNPDGRMLDGVIWKRFKAKKIISYAASFGIQGTRIKTFCVQDEMHDC